MKVLGVEREIPLNEIPDILIKYIASNIIKHQPNTIQFEEKGWMYLQIAGSIRTNIFDKKVIIRKACIDKRVIVMSK